MSSRHVALELPDGPVQVEYAWVGPADPGRPVLVFLHEGLGSLGLWKDFPEALCAATGQRGLVWSRPGYGRSTPRPKDRPLGVDFMHRQAETVLPALLAQLKVDAPYRLLGHSDGGSIALIHAARFAERVAGAIVLAPHILVEAFGLASIRATREAYLTGELRSRMARHHDDVDATFWGWNDIWLDPAFTAWQLNDLLPSIRCPVLAIQGEDDPYGTMAQIEGIAEQVPGTRLLKLPSCGHSPQRDQPAAVIAAVRDFLG